MTQLGLWFGPVMHPGYPSVFLTNRFHHYDGIPYTKERLCRTKI